VHIKTKFISHSYICQFVRPTAKSLSRPFGSVSLTTLVSGNVNVVTSFRLNGSTVDSVATEAKLFGIDNPAFGAGNLAKFLHGI